MVGLIHLLLLPHNFKNLYFISHFAKFIPEKCRSELIEHLKEVVEHFSKSKSENIHSLLLTYGKVAAQSEHRAVIFNRLRDDWKNSHSPQFRKNILMIIGLLAKDICVEQCLEAVDLHENANHQDNLAGLIDLTKNLTEKLKFPFGEQVDHAFQLFQRGLQDEQRENLRCVDIEALVQIHPLLSHEQRKLLLPLVISQFNRPENYSEYSLRMLLYWVVAGLPERERTPKLIGALADISYVDLVLRYRGLHSMEIEELKKLPKNERFYRLSLRIPKKMSDWVAVLEYASPVIARLITAKLLEIHPDNSVYRHTIVSLQAMTEGQRVGIAKAATLCQQENAGKWIKEQLIQRKGANIVLRISFY